MRNTKSFKELYNLGIKYLDCQGEMTPLRIKAIRNSFNLTQKNFADFINISSRTLENWECGHRRPSGPATALLYIAETHPEAFIKNKNKIIESFKKLI